MKEINAADTEVGKIYLSQHTAEDTPSGPYRVQIKEKLPTGKVGVFLVDYNTASEVAGDYVLVETDVEPQVAEVKRVQDPAEVRPEEVGSEGSEDDVEEDEDPGADDAAQYEDPPIEEYPVDSPVVGSVVGDVAALVGSEPGGTEGSTGAMGPEGPVGATGEVDMGHTGPAEDMKVNKKRVAKKKVVDKPKEPKEDGEDGEEDEQDKDVYTPTPYGLVQSALIDGKSTSRQIITGVKVLFPEKTDAQVRNLITGIRGKLKKNGTFVERQANGVYAVVSKKEPEDD